MSRRIQFVVVRLSWMLICVAVATVTGCGPSKILPQPDTLPKTLDEQRSLWHTPRAYIYARNKAIAGETDRWISNLQGYLQRTYDRDIGKGLVIVVDKNEKPIVDTLEVMTRLQRGVSAVAVTGPDKKVSVEELRRKLEEVGMSESLACSIALMNLDDDALNGVGLTCALPDEVAWRVCCPSQRLMEEAIWKFAPVALEKHMGKAFALMTAWAWPVAFAEAAKALRLGRDVTVFQIWASRQDDWSPEKRFAEVLRYTKQRAFVISPMLSLALTMVKKSAARTESQASTQQTNVATNSKQL